jgi:3-oxoacyl-[acyl-carrier protein] reductase
MAQASTTKCAVITGASGGIGSVVAKRLARDGFAVVVNYAGKPAKADEVVAAIKEAKGQAIAVQANVAEPADVERLFKQTIGAFGRVDVVVNCAGIMPMVPISGGDIKLFDNTININLRGSFIVMGQAVKNISPGGRIIMFSSSVLAKSFPGYGAYIASKAGVEGLVHVLINELRGRDITVNAIAPGPTGTELLYEGKSEQTLETLRKLSPLERIGTPEEVAAVVSFIVGPEGGWVHGQVLRVNGGFA